MITILLNSFIPLCVTYTDKTTVYRHQAQICINGSESWKYYLKFVNKYVDEKEKKKIQ